MTLHILHVRKCGGTAIKAALAPVANDLSITFHNHNTRLCDVAAEPVAFTVRDPVSRFVSGFRCRQRQGAPRYDIPWRPAEARAFSIFETPNDLAEALDSGPLQHEAWAAMSAIPHLAVPLRNWFTREDLELRKNIVWIGMQETLSEGFERLRRTLGLPAGVRLPDDPAEAHRAPSPSDTMSERANANVAAWYAEDMAIYDAARTHASAL